MTAEQIHDALTLLPADLIAETDKKRTQKPRSIPWKRYAAMAACFTLVLGCGIYCLQTVVVLNKVAGKGAPAAVQSSLRNETALPETQAAAPAAQAPRESPAEEAQITGDAQASAMGTLFPGIGQIRYLEARPGASTACFSGSPTPELFHSRADLETYHAETIQRFDPDQLLAACKDYDEAWFDEHDLLLITLCGVPTSESTKITAIRELVGGWEICVENYLDNAEAQRQDWHILIEVEKGLMASRDDILLVFE